jgi:hypothetical protein
VDIAVIVVDWENIWRSLIRNPQETRKSPVGFSAVFDGLREISEIFKRQGKKVFTFIFLPPYYSKLCVIAPAGLILSYCPTFGINRSRYNTADQNIMRVVRLIAEKGSFQRNIQNIFGIGALSEIEARATKIYQSGKVPIFWADGKNANEKYRLRKITKTALQNFLKDRGRVSDVCLISGDCDFKSMIERLQRKGVNVIVSLALNDSLSLGLLACANEFWNFPRRPPH